MVDLHNDILSIEERARDWQYGPSITQGVKREISNVIDKASGMRKRIETLMEKHSPKDPELFIVPTDQCKKCVRAACVEDGESYKLRKGEELNCCDPEKKVNRKIKNGFWDDGVLVHIDDERKSRGGWDDHPCRNVHARHIPVQTHRWLNQSHNVVIIQSLANKTEIEHGFVFRSAGVPISLRGQEVNILYRRRFGNVNVLDYIIHKYVGYVEYPSDDQKIYIHVACLQDEAYNKSMNKILLIN